MLAGGVAAGAAILWPSAAEQLDDAIVSGPSYTESFRVWERGWTRYYERLRIPVELRHSIDESVLGAGDAAVAYAHGSLLALIGVLSDMPWLVLVPVLAFLMLKDAAAIRRTVLHGAAAPDPAARPPAVRGAERDAGGLRPRAADRVRRGRHPVGRRLRAARQSVRDAARGAGRGAGVRPADRAARRGGRRGGDCRAARSDAGRLDRGVPRPCCAWWKTT